MNRDQMSLPIYTVALFRTEVLKVWGAAPVGALLVLGGELFV
jgi:hypothetical protein